MTIIYLYMYTLNLKLEFDSNYFWCYSINYKFTKIFITENIIKVLIDYQNYLKLLPHVVVYFDLENFQASNLNFLQRTYFLCNSGFWYIIN
mgnify:CR=1 FL=1